MGGTGVGWLRRAKETSEINPRHCPNPLNIPRSLGASTVTSEPVIVNFLLTNAQHGFDSKSPLKTKSARK